MATDEHRLISYCLRQGYFTMQEVQHFLALKARGKNIGSLIARKLGWDKEELRRALKAARRLPTMIRLSAGQKANSKRLGQYVLVAKLGTGGMGAVYRAYHTVLKTTFAIKILLSDRLDAQQLHRFKQEAQIASRLQHPNIVRVYDVGEQDGQHYIVMDYIAGRDLQQLLQQEGRLALRRAFTIGLQVAQALGYAHEQGIIHRDIKPANILIDRDDKPYVMDFGLAAMQNRNTRLTRTVQLLGTPQYMSPEQALGKARQLDARSDIYSLGVVLYEMLTNKPVVRGPTNAQLVYKVAYEAVRPPSRYNRTISPDAEAIVLKCLEKDPGQRFPSMAQLCGDIQRYLRGEAVLARPAGGWYRLRKWISRNRLLFGTLSLATLLFVTLITVFVVIKIQDMRRLQATTEQLQQALESSERDRRELQKALQAAKQAREMAQRERQHKQAQQRAQRLLDEAMRWSNEQRPLEKIIAKLEQAARLAPQYEAVYRCWGQVYYDYARHTPAQMQGALDKALGYLQKAVELDGSDYLSWFYQYLVYQAKGETTRARACLQKVVTLNPQNEYGAFSKGEALSIQLLQKPKPSAIATLQQQAIAAYNKALTYNPKFAWPYVNRGVIYSEQKRYALALADLQRAMELDPNNARAYYNRGIVYMTQKNYPAALRDFNHALALAPYHANIYNSRGLLYSRQGQYQQALTDYNHALRLNPRLVHAYNNRAAAYKQMHRYDAALTDYQRAITLDRGYLYAYHNRAHLYMEQHRYKAALADYNHAIALYPQRAVCYYKRGFLYSSQGHLAAGLADYNQALKLNPEYSEVYNNRGLLYMQQHQWNKSLADYNQAIRLDPQSWAVYVGRGFLYLQRQQYAEAIKDLELCRQYRGPADMITEYLQQARAALAKQQARNASPKHSASQ